MSVPVIPTIPTTGRPRNAFEFVTVAAARSRQLLAGCVPKVEGSPKPARRAQQEVIGGMISRVPEVPKDAKE